MASTTDVPARMRAVEASGGACRIGERAVPVPGDGEYLLKAHYSAINRADTLQRKGLYPPPPGAPDSLGLEVVGEVVSAGAGATGGFKPGDRVMALLAGGGNAEYVTVPGGQLMPIPEALDYKHAAAVPETWLTAFQLLHFVGHAQRGETVVVHAAGSGVGTAAVQLAIGAGCKVIAVAGSDEKLAAVRALAEETVGKIRASAPAAAGAAGEGAGGKEGGAHSGEPGELLATVNYKSNAEWGKAVAAASPGGHGVQLVLDPVGGSFWRGNVDALGMDGRWVLYGTMGGGSVEGGLFAQLLRKRIAITGSTLRSRSLGYKADLTRAFAAQALPRLAAGVYVPVVDREYPLEEVQAAHEYMETNANVGKIVLRIA